MAGAPEGNDNAAKGALYNSALKRALARSGKNVDGGLNKVCDQLVEAALNGESWAIKEIADRIDGKAHQSLGVDGHLTHDIITEVLLGNLEDDNSSR